MQPAATTNRRLEQGVRSRERILEAASRLMASRGYAATSISLIREECGLPASSIYWHFGSKEELLAAVMERGAERWFESLPSWREGPGGPEERLTRALSVLAARLGEQPEFLRLYLLLAIERREIDPVSLAPIRRIRERAIAGLRTMLADVLGGTGAAPSAARDLADELARFVLCFCDGCFVSHQIDPATTDLARLFEDLRIGILATVRSRVAEAGPAVQPGSSAR